MNVLIIINSFRLGGAEKVCYDLALKLSEKPNVNVFLYSVGKVETALEKELFNKFEKTLVSVGSFNKPYKRQRLRTALKIKRLCNIHHIDIIHTNGQSPDFLARCSKLIGNKSKVVVTVHSTIGYSKKLEHFFSRFTDAYTAVSKDALRYSKKDLGILQNVELIENGIEFSAYSGIENKEELFEILSVGRVQPEKDYVKAAHFLRDFLVQHKDVKWVIFGDCSYNQDYFDELNEECLKLGIKDSVVFKGVVTNPKDIYGHGKIFILASPFEGFGIAFIEAIMSDHFIFSRNVGVIQDILRNGGTVHDIENSESLNTLEQIYHKVYGEDELVKNKEIVKDLYSIDNMVSKYLRVYKQVL